MERLCNVPLFRGSEGYKEFMLDGPIVVTWRGEEKARYQCGIWNRIGEGEFSFIVHSPFALYNLEDLQECVDGAVEANVTHINAESVRFVKWRIGYPETLRYEPPHRT